MIGWTGERTERLTKLWHAGLSASQIAKELGGTSRNAVIGKCSRLGLIREGVGGTKPQHRTLSRSRIAAISGRDRRAGISTFCRETVTEVKARLKQAFGTRETATFKPQSAPETAKTILDGLSHHECRWPVTAPPLGLGYQTLFCCQPSGPGSPYCSAHHRLSVEAPSTPETRTRAAKLFERNLRRYTA